MRVGIYVDVARSESPTGIGRHILHLLDALAEIDQETEYLLYYPDRMLGKSSGFSHLPDTGNFRNRPVRCPANWHEQRPRIWWNHLLPGVLRRDCVDVFHGPNHFLPRFERQRNVVTIHDLAYFHMTVHGESMDAIMRDWTRHALENAGQAIALSENTKNDIVDLGFPAEQTHVIYGGGNLVPDDEIQFDRVAEMRKALNLPDQFILFLGALQPRKNVPFLVRGYAELVSRGDVAQDLVLAGPKNSATEAIEQLATEMGIRDRVHLTGYLDSWQIPLLYKEADLFVLPTRYEGFTLVTIESMGYGTPVVATNSSSIREGTGDAALLVDVDDVRQLADAMQRGLNDAALRERLIEDGKARSTLFTWKRNAEQTLALYRMMAEPSLAANA